VKRYALFCGDCYYPAGGWLDLVGFFDTVGAAKSAIKEPQDATSGWFWNIGDMQTGEVMDQEWNIDNSWWVSMKSASTGDELTGNEESLIDGGPLKGREIK
jgi:hypothetical protein